MQYRGEILVLKEVFEVIEDKVCNNTRMVLEESRTKKIMPRDAAMQLAIARVEKAMSFKRWSIS
jgi:glutamate dehydrogenase (NAD(P)+)